MLSFLNNRYPLSNIWSEENVGGFIQIQREFTRSKREIIGKHEYCKRKDALPHLLEKEGDIIHIF